MRTVVLCIIVCLTGISSSSAQESRIRIGREVYDATTTWQLRYFNESLDASIAKDGDRGLLVLSSWLPSESSFISGPITLYLEDDSFIECADRGIRDYVNSTATSVFYLTPSEIKKLAEVEIYSIRYRIRSRAAWSSDTGDFLVHNSGPRTNVLELLSNSKPPRKNRYDTAKAVRSLFQLGDDAVSSIRAQSTSLGDEDTSQCQLTFGRYEIHSRNKATGRVELEHTIPVSGTIIFHASSGELVVNREVGESETFKFETFTKVRDTGHYMGFSTGPDQPAFGYVPELRAISIVKGQVGRGYYVDETGAVCLERLLDEVSREN